MAFEQTQKEKVIDSLMAEHRQGQIAEINLRLQGKPDKAEKVWQEKPPFGGDRYPHRPDDG